MTKCSTGATLTLPLLKTYVTALSTALRAENTWSVATDDSSAKAELLWIMEDQTALSLLASHTTINQDPLNSVEYTTTTLPVLAKEAMLTRYQLACFWLPSLSEELLQPYIPLIMRHRDLYAAHVIIAVKVGIDLRTYGFIPFDINTDGSDVDSTQIDSTQIDSIHVHTQVVSSTITLWQFNLYDYKRLPNWLNSDYWANPENWDKRRW